jgi:hypothetical protein
MKWESPPLGLFAAPPLVGLAAAAIGFLLVPEKSFSSKYATDLYPLYMSWFCLLGLTGLMMFAVPQEWGDVKQMRFGLFAGTGVVFMPQIFGVALTFCNFWFFPVIAIWLFLSTYQWKLNAPPFRTGLWLGLGGLAGMYLGAFAFV